MYDYDILSRTLSELFLACFPRRRLGGQHVPSPFPAHEGTAQPPGSSGDPAVMWWSFYKPGKRKPILIRFWYFGIFCLIITIIIIIIIIIVISIIIIIIIIVIIIITTIIIITIVIIIIIIICIIIIIFCQLYTSPRKVVAEVSKIGHL